MTQEEKELVLKDLCARLPYEAIINVHDTYPYTVLPYFNIRLNSFVSTLASEPIFKTEDELIKRVLKEHVEYLEFRLFLRPLSSMTEEEKNNLGIILPCSMSFSYSTDGDLIIYTDEEYDSDHYFSKFVEVQDFLNAHHFDYRGLIPRGLALPALEGMYNI